MIEADKRRAVFLLHEQGMSAREISRRLGISRNTVDVIIEQKGAMPVVERARQHIDEALLRRLYEQCDGYAQRVHEKLTEEEGIAVSYPTLTRMLRQMEISKAAKPRCERVPDEPGEEMQHDTTVYTLLLGERQVRLVASLLYLRYSKRRYLKLYRAFNRFRMKCFLHEALMYWGYAPRECIIDNTNLARLRGIGANAVIVPEMERFAQQYGFRFRCHEKGHANRKAGEERSFWTVETNFLPGRTFQSLEDLNQQAFAWSTERMEQRPQGKGGLIPAKAFEFERTYLRKLPCGLCAPYRAHKRDTDQYGYVAFVGNYYWVPGTKRDAIKVLEYAERLKLYKARECLGQYPLPAEGVRNERFSPEGEPKPRHNPKNRRRPTQQEEQRLRAIDERVGAYLDFALPPGGIQRHGFLRKLHALSRKITAELFVASIERAHTYRIVEMATIERIVALNLAHGAGALPCVEVDEHFRERAAYQQGRLTEPPDLSIFNQEDEHEG